LAGVHDDRWSKVLHPCRRQVGASLCSSLKPETVDGINMEHLVPMSKRPDPLIHALWGWIGDNCLGRLMMVELFLRVGQHRVIVETIIGEREMLDPFHGKE
jgi:hypothetical protein